MASRAGREAANLESRGELVAGSSSLTLERHQQGRTARFLASTTVVTWRSQAMGTEWRTGCSVLPNWEWVDGQGSRSCLYVILAVLLFANDFLQLNTHIQVFRTSSG